MIDIRDECPRDWKAVYQVISAAFGQSAEAKLVEELREAGDSVISLVAEEDSQVVAHVLLSKMDAPFPALALAPVSVIPARQRSGIGSALIQSAVNRARSEGWTAIFVLGPRRGLELAANRKRVDASGVVSSHTAELPKDPRSCLA